MRSVDRLFLHGYLPSLQTPGQLVRFLLDRGYPIRSLAPLGHGVRRYANAVGECRRQMPDERWLTTVDQDGSERPNGQVCEITTGLDPSTWPTGSRVIVRRERPHPARSWTFTDQDGYRFQATLTDQPDQSIVELERRHRARAGVEDQIRNDKDTGLRSLPFREFEHNRVWLQLVLLAHDLIGWSQRLLLTSELARCEPKRLRYRLLHRRAPRLPRPHRHSTPASWPWASELAAAFARLKALPAPAGCPGPPAPVKNTSLARRPRHENRGLRGRSPESRTRARISRRAVETRYETRP